MQKELQIINLWAILLRILSLVSESLSVCHNVSVGVRRTTWKVQEEVSATDFLVSEDLKEDR